MDHLRTAAVGALRWFLIATVIGMVAGAASALLLHALDLATSLREAHRWLIALLPLAGFAMGCLYHYFGRSVERGNNLILEELHHPGETIPLRMTPLVLLGTFVTHVFGGSAGREGTAIQTGASLADQLSRPLRLSPVSRRMVLMSGISAGFGSVFGVPLAGAIFGAEVLALGTITYEAIGPCLLASVIGDLTTRSLYAHHASYVVSQAPTLNLPRVGEAILAGTLFGVVARLFVWLNHATARLFGRIAYAPLRPLLGGMLIGALVLATGTTRYIGLGTQTIGDAFHIKLPAYAFASKLALTVLTLGSGFKGGEVTPLFFIGSTFGNALSGLLPLPSALLAAMGLVAVFAGAANTPIASILMALELFGTQTGVYCGIACVLSYLCSGHVGMYHAQRIAVAKHPHSPHTETRTQLTETSLPS